jgi:hypothetical protein
MISLWLESTFAVLFNSYLHREKAVSPEDFGVIDQLVAKEIEKKAPFERIVVPKAVALEMFKVTFFRIFITVISTINSNIKF